MTDLSPWLLAYLVGMPVAFVVLAILYTRDTMETREYLLRLQASGENIKDSDIPRDALFNWSCFVAAAIYAPLWPYWIAHEFVKYVWNLIIDWVL